MHSGPHTNTLSGLRTSCFLAPVLRSAYTAGTRFPWRTVCDGRHPASTQLLLVVIVTTICSPQKNKNSGRQSSEVVETVSCIQTARERERDRERGPKQASHRMQWTWTLCLSLTALTLALLLPQIAVQANSEPELLEKQLLYTNDRSSYSDCSLECKSGKRRPVCGTDGKTYLSKCDLRRAVKCERKNVSVKSRGSCTDVSRRPANCHEERQEALRDQQRDPSAGVYVPSCKDDGTFAHEQCHNGSQFCWCVNSHGTPIPNTTVKGTHAHCTHTTGSKQRRSGRAQRRDRSQSGDSSSRSCSKIDRYEFNVNLIKLLTEEYERIPEDERPTPPGPTEGDPLRDTPEKRIIEWKFAVLDKDNNNKLQRTEIRSLKKMIKKLVKPKACAKTFEEYCDIDNDKRIAPSEWSICLGVDIDKGMRVVPRGGGPTILKGRPPLQPSPEKQQTETPRTQSDISMPEGCEEERKKALVEHQDDPQNGIFVPECTDTGLFRREQCHASTGYCWCVDQKTGFPIPGTSTHNITPDCNNLKHRPFKGCPYQAKRDFLTGLLDQLTKSMADFASNNSNSDLFSSEEEEKTLEERAAMWKLRLLDKNKNLKLERKELKDFKSEIKRSKKLRKCGRNFLRYCDANNDHMISKEEWLDCVGLNEPNRNLPKRPRRGPNPFSNILKSYSDPVREF